jgi:hypothetical protein
MDGGGGVRLLWIAIYFSYILQHEREKREDHHIAVTPDECIRNCVLGIQLIQLEKLDLFLILMPMFFILCQVLTLHYLVRQLVGLKREAQ